MHVLRLLLAAWFVLLISLAGATEMDKTTLSDAGLRGQVRQCIEQTIYPADGSLPERSLTRSQSGSRPDVVVTYAYDGAGRVVNKSVSTGPSAADRSSTSYTYDDNGQLLAAKSSNGDTGTAYEYDNHDGKRRIERLPVFTPQPNAGVGAMSWENSELPLMPSSGGTLTTLYADHDRPIEGRVNDADGRLTVRIVRTYDAEGRVLGDKLIPEDVQSAVPEQWAGQMNDAQKKAIGKLISNAYANGESGYKYDSEGRVVEKHRVGGAFGDELTRIAFNDHGDVSEEVTVLAMGPDFGTVYGVDDEGNVVPESKSEVPGPTQNETRYSYEYDSHGNWTRKATSGRQGQAEFKTSVIITRNLSYY